MDDLLKTFFENLPLVLLFLVIAVMLAAISKGADMLVDEAVSLSLHWRIPKMIIGTTIVSIGTTLPEAAVSVMAAINGDPDLALGNAVGSIIADTGLIIGISAFFGHLYIHRKTITRQGTIKLISGILLFAACLPFMTRREGGHVTQFMGILFLVMLVIYMYGSIKWSRQTDIDDSQIKEEKAPVVYQILKLALGAGIVIVSSRILIPAVGVTALRAGIPQSIIAATLVAFGTSLPELVTAITAVRKGHGEIAVGNIVGADILNVFFVIGASAAVTKGGLDVPKEFLTLHLPVMLILLILFRIFTNKRYKEVSKVSSSILLGIYIIYILFSYLS